MSKRRRPQAPPVRPPPGGSSGSGLLELDRFSAANLERWKRISADLDELSDILYSGIEPQRQRHYGELIEALQSVPKSPLHFERWTRLVSYRYALSPLSAAGSLMSYGGRFNVGLDVDKAIRAPWPALYIGENFQTAFREKFQISKDERVDGLSPEELALTPGGSFTAVQLDGHLELVFDLGQEGVLDPLCGILSKMSLPAEARRLQKRLGLSNQQVYMVRSASRLLNDALVKNWRGAPVQFGVPATSQILAGLILDAGYEAIRYPSTMGGGECVAVFPHKLASDRSHVALSDVAPLGVEFTRLDMGTADALCGWELLPACHRPRTT